MLGFKKLKCDVDEQLPEKHFNLKWCNVFNFTPSDGVAPSKDYPGEAGGGDEGTRAWREERGWSLEPFVAENKA